jgi:enoyl-CoA hydratase
MTDAITYEQAGNSALIVLDDGKANAFGFDFIDAFNAKLDRAEKDSDAVAIIGRPGLLSGGFDLAVIRGGDEGELRRLVNAGARLLMRLYGHPQPVIVGATGHAVALGAFMLLSADYRVGTRGDFKIGLNETAIGLSLPEFGIALAHDRISRRKLTQATLGATLYDPDSARDIGYIDEITSADTLRETALAHANSMAELDGPAFAASKEMLRGATIQRVLAGLG